MNEPEQLPPTTDEAVEEEQINSAPAPISPESDPTPPDPKPDFARQRLLSLDAYRGLIMVTLAFTGFGLARTAAQHLFVIKAWNFVHYQFSHVQWVGCSYWDLIQPSFMFMVGVAMAYSYAKRQKLGQSYLWMLLHAISRSLILILLAVFLSSNGRTPQEGPTTNWSFMNVLGQIGLGYTFLFLLWGKSWRTQALAAGAILVGTWLMYVTYPTKGIDLERGAPKVKVSQQWAQEHLTGIAPAWHKNANVGTAIDVRVLNMFPRSEPFVCYSGGYQTINFLPSLATMIFGLMAGELLRSRLSQIQKLRWLAYAGVIGLMVGQGLDMTGICPVIKRIWTPSWAIFSGGWCCLILAGLFAVIDVLGYQRWSFPLIVVGMNSIAIYMMAQLLKPWATRTLGIHLGKEVFEILGKLNEPFVQYTLIGLMFWVFCWWMYRQKIFVRI